jgi:hypothetical protein
MFKIKMLFKYMILFTIVVISLSINKNQVFSNLDNRPDIFFRFAQVIGDSDGQIKYEYLIENRGADTIPNIYNISIQNFYSRDKVFNNGDDKAAGGRILGVNKSLAYGEQYSGTFYSSVDIPEGMRYLTFKIDWGNIIDEKDETNNTKWLTLLPDLQYAMIDYTSEITPTGINYECAITNAGGKTIPSLYYVAVQNFYSEDYNLDSTDIPAGGRIFADSRSLSPNEDYYFKYRTFGSIPSNMNYLIVVTDFTNKIIEENEKNAISVELPD